MYQKTQENLSMSHNQKPDHPLKKKVSDIITLLNESKILADQTPDMDPAIQTTLTFLLKSAIDLNYQVHDFVIASQHAEETDTNTSS